MTPLLTVRAADGWCIVHAGQRVAVFASPTDHRGRAWLGLSKARTVGAELVEKSMIVSDIGTHPCIRMDGVLTDNAYMPDSMQRAVGWSVPSDEGPNDHVFRVPVGHVVGSVNVLDCHRADEDHCRCEDADPWARHDRRGYHYVLELDRHFPAAVPAPQRTPGLSDSEGIPLSDRLRYTAARALAR